MRTTSGAQGTLGFQEEVVVLASGNPVLVPNPGMLANRTGKIDNSRNASMTLPVKYLRVIRSSIVHQW